MTSLSSVGPTTSQQCPDCQRAQLFEPVVPNHRIDSDAPEEWACTVCGAALLVDPAWDVPDRAGQGREQHAQTATTPGRVA